MAEKSLATEIRSILASERIHLFGTAPASLMENETPGHRPSDLLPGAKSLICFAVPVPQSVYAAPRYKTETIWRTQNLLYRRLDTISIRIAEIIERHGYLSLPNFGCLPMDMNKKGEVTGFINQIQMGRLTGIGFIGKNGLLMHPAYGPRIMLGSVLTCAKLDLPNGIENASGECPAGCCACVDACPVKAINAVNKNVSIMKCLFHTAISPLLPILRFLFLRKIKPAAAARLLNLFCFDEHTMHKCSACIAVCPIGKAVKAKA